VAGCYTHWVISALIDNAYLKKVGNSSALYVMIIMTHCGGIHLIAGGAVLVRSEQNSPVALNFSWKPMD
jgi:hypothetical protein